MTKNVIEYQCLTTKSVKQNKYAYTMTKLLTKRVHSTHTSHLLGGKGSWHMKHVLASHCCMQATCTRQGGSLDAVRPAHSGHVNVFWFARSSKQITHAIVATAHPHTRALMSRLLES